MKNSRVIITSYELVKPTRWWKPNTYETVEYLLRVDEDGYVIYEKK